MSRRGSVASQWTEYKFTCVSVCPSHFLSTRQHARRRLRTSLLRWRRHLGLSVHVAWLWPTPSVPRHLRSRRAALQATTFVYVRPFDRGRIYTFKSNPLRCILDLLIRWDCRRTSAWWTSLVRRRHLETEHLPSPDRVSGTAFLLPSVIRHCRRQSSESCWKLICLFKGRGAGDLWTGALEMYWLTNELTNSCNQFLNSLVVTAECSAVNDDDKRLNFRHFVKSIIF